MTSAGSTPAQIALSARDRARIANAYKARFNHEPSRTEWEKVEAVLDVYRRRRTPSKAVTHLIGVIQRAANPWDAFTDLRQAQQAEISRRALGPTFDRRPPIRRELSPDGYRLGEIEHDAVQLIPVLRFGSRVSTVGGRDIRDRAAHTDDRFLLTSTLVSAGVALPMSPTRRLWLRLDHPLLAQVCGASDLPDHGN